MRTFFLTPLKNGFPLNKCTNILDFGCGCGRIIRHFSDLPGSLYGTDYNPYLVGWCNRYLRGKYTVNLSAGPLSFSNEFFDCIYSYSVFTHLTEPVQVWWTKELSRILTSGGVLLVTVHGKSHLHSLVPESQQLFNEGKSVVVHTYLEGQNLCISFHPEKWMSDLFEPEGLSIIDIVPGNTFPDLSQDIYILKKH